MAGTLTHFCIMKKYFEKYDDTCSNSIPYNLKGPYLATSFLGSTGPDIFYIGAENQYIQVIINIV